MLTGIKADTAEESRSEDEADEESVMMEENSIGVQVNPQPIPRKNARVQTNIKHRDRGVMTEMRRTSDVGVQCDLLPKLKSSSPVADTDDEVAECMELDTSMYVPSETASTSSSSQTSEEDSGKPIRALEDKKYIVFESSLMKLFRRCSVCQSSTDTSTFTKGTFLRISQTCHLCGTENNWESQPLIKNTPAGNLLLSAAILYSGALPTKSLRIFEFMNCAVISPSAFFGHQQHYLHPAIRRTWKAKQSNIIQSLKRDDLPLIVGGDGRADSPGHSAKFGSYSIMDLVNNRILDIQLVQSNEVKGSYHMEIEGLIHAVQYLKSHGLVIDQFVTDCHKQIAKYFHEKLPDTKHYYDVWHVAKSFRKKIEALAKKKDCEVVGEWCRSMINHLYWCAMSTEEGNEELIRAKWLSLVNHIQNVHRGHDTLFPKCLHKRLKGRKWIKPNTKASEKVEAIIANKMFVKDVGKLSTSYQTSALEAFHSVIIHFAPKSTAFSYFGMTSRLYLAALHYNENCKRQQATRLDGVPKYDIVFPKYKKGHVVKKVLEDQTFNYVAELMEVTLQICGQSGIAESNFIQMQPPPLSDTFERPDKSEAILQHTSRFKS